ncbi:MAG: HAMP domain-containing histidine kinase [Actinomycetales bacterium]|nr:HAMP domain-containing histidine kinase [Actinomycetales bacterium]
MPQRFGRGTSRPWSVRARVIALVVTMLTIGLTLAGLVVFTVQFSDLNRRIDSELLQEVDEVRELARNGPPTTDLPYTDLGQLFEAYLSVSLPNEHESMVTLIDAVVAFIPGGEMAFSLNDPRVVEVAQERRIPGRAVIFDFALDERDLRMIVSDVALPEEQRKGTLVVAIDAGTQRAAIWRQVGTYALVALGVILLTGATGYVVAGRLLRPLTDLAAAASTIDAEDLTQRVKVSSADNDVAQLAVTFNQMLDRLERGVADQRQFLDDAAHELRTPLTIIRGNLEIMDVGDVEDVDQTRELVLDETDRMKRLVDDLLMLARSQRPDFVTFESVDVQALGREIQDKVHRVSHHEWEVSTTAAGVVIGDRQRLQQATFQLAANAAKFSEDGSRVEISLSWSPPTAEVAGRVAQVANRYLVIAVRDHGTGISPEEAERIFERFGRSESHHTVEGSGLGLPIVVVIAEAHRGTVTLDSVLGSGSTFRIWIPAEM